MQRRLLFTRPFSLLTLQCFGLTGHFQVAVTKEPTAHSEHNILANSHQCNQAKGYSFHWLTPLNAIQAKSFSCKWLTHINAIQAKSFSCKLLTHINAIEAKCFSCKWLIHLKAIQAKHFSCKWLIHLKAIQAEVSFATGKFVSSWSVLCCA
jgi:hypothetical protein